MKNYSRFIFAFIALALIHSSLSLSVDMFIQKGINISMTHNFLTDFCFDLRECSQLVPFRITGTFEIENYNPQHKYKLYMSGFYLDFSDKQIELSQKTEVNQIFNPYFSCADNGCIWLVQFTAWVNEQFHEWVTIKSSDLKICSVHSGYCIENSNSYLSDNTKTFKISNNLK